MRTLRVSSTDVQNNFSGFGRNNLVTDSAGYQILKKFWEIRHFVWQPKFAAFLRTIGGR